jgi:hypothetical protein
VYEHSLGKSRALRKLQASEINFSPQRKRGAVAESPAMVIHGRRMRNKTLQYRHGEGGLL